MIVNCRCGGCASVRAAPRGRPHKWPGWTSVVAMAKPASGSLDGRIAVITSSGRGIGRQHVLLFARDWRTGPAPQT
jgi:hypothetical protein